MTTPGSEATPLRVAIIGSGPAAFYAAEYLLRQGDVNVEVDVFDRLPTPFGLVRGGVAPDHQKIKSVTKVYDKVAAKPAFRFFGNVEYGGDVTLDDLKRHYHQIVFATGAQTDRQMNVPGEDLEGSHPATEFVAWYNGHPDFVDHQFDLSQERVAIVGVGNVAVDVARILCRTPQELAETDIADYALEALRESRVKEVIMLGRRGPAQAAFTNPEVKELGELPGADLVILPEEAALDDLTREALEAGADRETLRKVELLQGFAAQEPAGKPRRLAIRFLVSPTEIVGDAEGKVASMKLVKNELYASDDGSLRPRATQATQEIPVGLVFRSVGYRGVPLPDVPFYEKWGVINNENGRVTKLDGGGHLVGLYCTGWIKRGPSGVIGTNKPDSVETAKLMLEDVGNGVVLSPEKPDAASAEALVKQRQPDYFSFADWQRLDALEASRGEAQGRPRVKYTSVRAMRAALSGQPEPH